MDKIANIASTIENAQQRQKFKCFLHFSLKTQRILNILFIEGYIKGFKTISWSTTLNTNGSNNTKNSPLMFEVFLKYSENKENGKSFLKIKRISRPGKKVYTLSKDINKIKRGLGSLILSTSKGILSDRDARYLKIGGEALCIVS
jgi:small subunit ribosomal protein S8